MNNLIWQYGCSKCSLLLCTSCMVGHAWIYTIIAWHPKGSCLSANRGTASSTTAVLSEIWISPLVQLNDLKVIALIPLAGSSKPFEEKVARIHTFSATVGMFKFHCGKISCIHTGVLYICRKLLLWWSSEGGHLHDQPSMEVIFTLCL